MTSRNCTTMALLLTVTACAHQEDRRWKSLSVAQVRTLPADQQPSVVVYSFPTPPPLASKTRVRDLSDRGQQAFIAALALKGIDAEALRKAVAKPIDALPPAPGADATALERTVVINVSKPIGSQVGDRLMRTIVTIRPTAGQFEFAGYTIVATDNKLLPIAHLEDESNQSLDVSLAPKIGGFGDNTVGGKLSHSAKSTTDVNQQFENLGVDISPDRLAITRESERNLDVQGNTIIALTLVPPPAAMTATALLADKFEGFDKGKRLSSAKTKLEVEPISYLRSCALQADVVLDYVMRHIDRGQEYYTEGKQTVSLVPGRAQTQVELVRASETQPPLFQISLLRQGRTQGSLLARLSNGTSAPLLFGSFDEARAFATWLNGWDHRPLGESGTVVTSGDAKLDRTALFQASRYMLDCPIGH